MASAWNPPSRGPRSLPPPAAAGTRQASPFRDSGEEDEDDYMEEVLDLARRGGAERAEVAADFSEEEEEEEEEDEEEEDDRDLDDVEEEDDGSESDHVEEEDEESALPWRTEPERAEMFDGSEEEDADYDPEEEDEESDLAADGEMEGVGTLVDEEGSEYDPSVTELGIDDGEGYDEGLDVPPHVESGRVEASDDGEEDDENEEDGVDEEGNFTLEHQLAATELGIFYNEEDDEDYEPTEGEEGEEDEEGDANGYYYGDDGGLELLHADFEAEMFGASHDEIMEFGADGSSNSGLDGSEGEPMEVDEVEGLGRETGDADASGGIVVESSIDAASTSAVPSCPICLTPWSSEGSHRVCCLPCGHVYGRSCLERWLRRCGNNLGKCPQCMRTFRYEDIINLFAFPLAVPSDEPQKASEEKYDPQMVEGSSSLRAPRFPVLDSSSAESVQTPTAASQGPPRTLESLLADFDDFRDVITRRLDDLEQRVNEFDRVLRVHFCTAFPQNPPASSNN